MTTATETECHCGAPATTQEIPVVHDGEGGMARKGDPVDVCAGCAAVAREYPEAERPAIEGEPDAESDADGGSGR